MKVAVIGGGVSGLSACYHLEKLGASDIVLFEPSERLGGKLHTVFENGFCVECGPDSIFTRQPEILEFIDEIGLADEVIEPAARGFSIWIDGALREIPAGLTRLGSIDPIALEQFPHLSQESKRQILNEKNVPANLSEDESVRSFFSRRFGAEYSAKIAEPLFAGTHGGNAECLGMQSLYPSYRALERRFGSLAEAAKDGAMTSIAKFVSFRKGTQTLVAKMSGLLSRTKIILESVSMLEAGGSQITIHGRGFDAVIVAVPAHDALPLFQQTDPHVSSLLSRIQASSSTVVTFGFEALSESVNLFGTGFLVSEQEGRGATGATWSSRKWSGRAPDGFDLVRVFLQGTPMNAEEVARNSLLEMVGLQAEPCYIRVDAWSRGLPQYRIGHGTLISQIEARLSSLGRIYLAGQSYRGVGIPDCIRQGRKAAESAVIL